MSSRGYQQYEGNPYGQAEAGYGQSNPYGGEALNAPSGYGASNPYGGGPDIHGEQSSNPYGGSTNYSQSSQYSAPQEPMQTAPPTNLTGAPLPLQDFLGRIDGVKRRIGHLSSSIQEIASVHQRLLSSTDAQASSQLEALITDTQVRNTQIKDEIKFLERDAARDPSNSSKRSQIEAVKRSFKSQLDDFYAEESSYSKRYREAIARQYRIVNPEATEEEVQEAANADWGEEGIFTQALKTNRTGQAASVLGAVRARHNDIQRIEKTMAELSLLFQQLDEQVVYQQTAVDQTEEMTHQVVDDNKAAHEQLDRGIQHARRARKLKWWMLIIVVLIICILALVLGLVFGLKNNG
ncbi:t-SNARE [Westerdykella ornata]|uniref:t-SNARE n=1 Tax=Westerdykella ornata TaxID=318751 RepID=A0A6A6J800_WESOR|nr:t-SNARE [Westerdykella ornata]KAF2272532.1 t-SNARE [Westerdykella ornata]